MKEKESNMTPYARRSRKIRPFFNVEKNGPDHTVRVHL